MVTLDIYSCEDNRNIKSIDFYKGQIPRVGEHITIIEFDKAYNEVTKIYKILNVTWITTPHREGFNIVKLEVNK